MGFDIVENQNFEIPSVYNKYNHYVEERIKRATLA